MEPQQRKRAICILKKYPKWQSERRIRIDYLKHPTPAPDDNVGGGKSNRIQKPEEEYVIKKENDPKLRLLDINIESVDEAYRMSSNMIKDYVSHNYFTHNNSKTIAGFLTDYPYSRRIFYNQFNDFLNDILINFKMIKPNRDKTVKIALQKRENYGLKKG